MWLCSLSLHALCDSQQRKKLILPNNIACNIFSQFDPKYFWNFQITLSVEASDNETYAREGSDSDEEEYNSEVDGVQMDTLRVLTGKELLDLFKALCPPPNPASVDRNGRQRRPTVGLVCVWVQMRYSMCQVNAEWKELDVKEGRASWYADNVSLPWLGGIHFLFAFINNLGGEERNIFIFYRRHVARHQPC